MTDGLLLLHAFPLDATMWSPQVSAFERDVPVAAPSTSMADRSDSTPDLATIDVPTLVITSTGDTLIPPEVTKPMAGQIPGARLEVIEGAGHLSNLESPEEFNRFLREHLIRCG